MEDAVLEPRARYRLILIGTVHGDPQGLGRAGKLLLHLRPDLVTVEISPFSLGYRLKHGRGPAAAAGGSPGGAARRGGTPPGHPAPDGPSGFAVRGPAAIDYSRRVHVPWRPLDVVFVQAAPAQV